MVSLSMFFPLALSMPEEEQNQGLSHQDSALLFIRMLQDELAKSNTSTTAPATLRRDKTGGQISRLLARKSTTPSTGEEAGQ
jgi:hypothetical protein